MANNGRETACSLSKLARPSAGWPTSALDFPLAAKVDPVVTGQSRETTAASECPVALTDSGRLVQTAPNNEATSVLIDREMFPSNEKPFGKMEAGRETEEAHAGVFCRQELTINKEREKRQPAMLTE